MQPEAGIKQFGHNKEILLLGRYHKLNGNVGSEGERRDLSAVIQDSVAHCIERHFLTQICHQKISVNSSLQAVHVLVVLIVVMGIELATISNFIAALGNLEYLGERESAWSAQASQAKEVQVRKKELPIACVKLQWKVWWNRLLIQCQLKLT